MIHPAQISIHIAIDRRIHFCLFASLEKSFFFQSDVFLCFLASQEKQTDLFEMSKKARKEPRFGFWLFLLFDEKIQSDHAYRVRWFPSLNLCLILLKARQNNTHTVRNFFLSLSKVNFRSTALSEKIMVDWQKIHGTLGNVFLKLELESSKN